MEMNAAEFVIQHDMNADDGTIFRLVIGPDSFCPCGRLSHDLSIAVGGEDAPAGFVTLSALCGFCLPGYFC